MIFIPDWIVGCIGLIAGGYLYPYFHEYVHWVIGKLFSGDPSVLYGSWYAVPFPYAVKYRELTQMPDWGVRIAGISPHIIWMTVAIFYIGNPLVVVDTNIFITINNISNSISSVPLLILIFITASAGAGVGVSPSDLVATLRPNKFREYAESELSHLDWGKVLIGRID